jgi:hypothetical protein
MEDFKINREGNLISQTHRECTNKNCKKIFKKTSKTVTLCNECNSNRVKGRDKKTKMLNGAKNRAKIKNLDFNIDLSDIIIPEYCPVLKIKLNVHKGIPGGKKDSPALDRINNNIGYVKGNVRVISHLANMMKSHANNEELLLFAKWINNTLAESNELS